jgi:hypothetical protein
LPTWAGAGRVHSFVCYLIVNAVFTVTLSLEYFWSAIFDPVGLHLVRAILSPYCRAGFCKTNVPFN